MPTIDLTKSEIDVMRILWNAGEDLSLQEILKRTEDVYQKQWKRQTLSTFLTHLIDKGMLQSYRIGRVFYYRVIVDKDEYKRLTAKHVLDYWYDGSKSDFVAALFKNEKMTKEKKDKVRELIDELDD